MAFATTLNRIKSIRDDKLNQNVSFDNIYDLKEWFKNQTPDLPKNMPTFDFTGHIVNTIFDESGDNRWSRI